MKVRDWIRKSTLYIEGRMIAKLSERTWWGRSGKGKGGKMEFDKKIKIKKGSSFHKKSNGEG